MFLLSVLHAFTGRKKHRINEKSDASPDIPYEKEKDEYDYDEIVYFDKYEN